MSKLFEDNNSGSDEDIKINNGYATNYNNWRQKEELNKLKTKYGEHIEDFESSTGDSESTSEDDDEDAHKLTEVFEKDFYKTLACLKKKDPRIYDENEEFFSASKEIPENPENVASQIKNKTKKDKAFTLRDYERRMVIERTEQFSESDDEDTFRKKNHETNTLTYVKEQEKLRESMKQVFQDEDDESDAEEDLLVPKHKSQAEKQEEDDSYKKWLMGQRTEIEISEKETLEPLRDFWIDPNLDKNEKFLRDYILNKKFLEGDTNNSGHYGYSVHNANENLSEDEKHIEEQEEFEHKFNFRFEEPDTDFLKRYPRTMENSLRKKDTRRSKKRAEVKERKEEEKAKKREELKHLKVLKRKEIAEKIAQLKEITGDDNMQFDSIDLEADFDPAEHDRKMKALFNEDYYKDGEENVKPEFPDIDEELGVESTWDNYDPTIEKIELERGYENLHCEDAEFNMDADCVPIKSLQAELGGLSRKKRRRRSKFAEMMSKDKPKFDPKVHASYKHYIDQYYALDYEDMIGDLPCRFKYRNVVPNDYGLSVEEILMADDKELNKWCSLKKALEHKPDNQQLYEVKTYQQKSSNEAYKKKVLKSLYQPVGEKRKNDNGDIEETPTNNKRRRCKKRDKSATNVDGVPTSVPVDSREDIIGNKATEVKLAIDTKRKAVQTETTVDATNGEEDPQRKKGKTGNSGRIKKESKTVGKTNNDNHKTREKNNINVTGNFPQTPNNFTKKWKDSESKQALRREKYKHLQKTKKTKEVKNFKDPLITSLSDERLKAYGINPKNFKNKQKYGKQN